MFLTHLHIIPHNDKVKTCFLKLLYIYFKLKTEISHFTYVFTTLSQYFVEVHLTAIKRFPHLDCATFAS